jgi:hypothetical protein
VFAPTVVPKEKGELIDGKSPNKEVVALFILLRIPPPRIPPFNFFDRLPPPFICICLASTIFVGVCGSMFPPDAVLNELYVFVGTADNVPPATLSWVELVKLPPDIIGSND